MGESVGTLLEKGRLDGTPVGSALGADDGSAVGVSVGDDVGSALGADDGRAVGYLIRGDMGYKVGAILVIGR